jgi:hypothetical protein
MADGDVCDTSAEDLSLTPALLEAVNWNMYE